MVSSHGMKLQCPDFTQLQLIPYSAISKGRANRYPRALFAVLF